MDYKETTGYSSKKWYDDVTSRIKWKGELSHQISEKQGVRQGGTWSPTAYKIFIDPLLQLFEQNQLGAFIGNIYCGIPTVADDVTLITSDPYELQCMLDVQANYANKQRYLLSEQKSTILVYNDKSEGPKEWFLNGKQLAVSESATHLGILRKSTTNSSKDLVSARIQTARRTVYSLMGAGLHGLNGINPKISAHLIQIYVLPRLLYGLEVVCLNQSNINNLEQYYRKLLKQIQHLPDRTSTAAVFLLLGRIPVEGELHKKILKTFGNIIRNEGSIERQIAIRQMAMKSTNSGSWFPKVTEIAEKYALPNLHGLIETPPSKENWNKLVNKVVENFYFTQLQKEAREKSTLNYINFSNNVKSVHNIWSTCKTDTRAITMAHVKVKIATGTMMLQERKFRFSTGTTSPLCLLCKTEDEDIKHFIIRCPSLADTRNQFLEELRRYMNTRQLGQSLIHELMCNDENLLQLIIDCTAFHSLNRAETARIEVLSRGMCYKLYQERAALLNRI